MAFNQAWKGEAENRKDNHLRRLLLCKQKKDAKGSDPRVGQGRKPDMFIAGPAFSAGRYGYACANVAPRGTGRAGHPRSYRYVRREPRRRPEEQGPHMRPPAPPVCAAPGAPSLALKLEGGEGNPAPPCMRRLYVAQHPPRTSSRRSAAPSAP